MCIGCIITFLRWPSQRSLKRHFNSLRHPTKSMARTRENMCGKKSSVEQIKCGKSVSGTEQFTIWLPSCKFKSNKNSIRCRIKSAIKHDKIKTKTKHNPSLRTAHEIEKEKERVCVVDMVNEQTATVQLLQSHMNCDIYFANRLSVTVLMPTNEPSHSPHFDGNFGSQSHWLTRIQINMKPSLSITCVYSFLTHGLWLFDHHANNNSNVYEYVTRLG